MLYTASGTDGVNGTLYTVDPATGAVLTTVGPLHDAANNPYGLAGLKYHPFTGILYGVTSGQSPTNPSYLAIVDPATALVTPIGPNGAVLTDIAIDPQSPNILYAAAYQRRRTVFGYNGGGPHSGLYRSTDGGVH